MIEPNFLKPQDKVAIICTARAVDKKELKSALNMLKSWQLEPVIGKTIGLKYHQFGGTDHERAADLQHQINNPEIKAIWCAKGGYGTARMIDQIDFSPLLKNPKWIIGYSDVTALHLKLQGLGICSLHAQMPVDIQNKSETTRESLIQSLMSKPFNIEYISPFNSQAGHASGQLIGGNLSVLYSVLGSEPLPSFRDKILFLEDLDEYLYHIDRMILSLKRQEILKHIKGLIVGGMNAMNDNTIPFGQNAYEIINHYTKNLNIPIAYDCPVGHGCENYALTLGATVDLKVENNQVSIKY
ncbi:S66 peptidase family protein [Mesohalobacter halotolerans]|uniref:LD-carboxypeptidase n=1 Tax=Mesohalobacter halotolerans TaxID=1883405 RepID=A0A4V6XY98_9FLAO|nr:LD-carboxypeptidase [Mesohalobacter halotolerans]MBS3737605.1 LD-carboxypeptidase [Psychroflexus sp.]TKS55435.1 LD-carboxypeptidase [Mesohalobacter halotolerans]